MAKYMVYENAAGKVVSVPTGFSWGAFLFGPLWAVVKRAWSLFFVLLFADVLLFVLGALAEQLSEGMAMALIFLFLNLLLMFICGKFANAWLRAVLLRKGYRQVGSY